MTLDSFVLIWIATAVVTFFYLLYKAAPYGRHVAKGWGPTLKNSTAWLLMETPVFIIVAIYLVANFPETEWPEILLISLFLLHYFNRCFIYPFRIKSNNTKMPLTIVLSAVFFNLVNGNLIGYYCTSANVQVDSLPFVAGCFLFLIGLTINVTADETLIKIKRSSEGYVIPRAGLYKYVSSPNYFGEMLEWLGFAIAASNLGAWSFFIWTFANLFPRAISNHRWYKAKFSDYPSSRKALIPFVV